MITSSNGITIRKTAISEVVTVTCDDHTTTIFLDDVTHYNKTRFLSALVGWALDGYKGNPPILAK